MTHDDVLGNEGSVSQPERYPLDEVELSAVASVAQLIRSRTSSMSPHVLRSAAALRLALKRLPYATPCVDVSCCSASNFDPLDSNNVNWLES